MNALLERVRAHKSGVPAGIHAVCSAHPLVIEATLRLAQRTGGMALIEATSNQVNQDGGYTGMRPAAFRDRLLAIASAVGLAHDRVLLGGDHLGPNCWQRLASPTALQKAAVMVEEYVTAGFRKIHLDCSMACADDPQALGDDAIAERNARLCGIAEAAWHRAGGESPVYIIGSEVPVPGGAHEALGELAVTTPAAALATIEAQRLAFTRHGVGAAWERVVAVVVQPGVEFDNQRVIDYVPAKAGSLSRSIEAVPGMVFEAHSTDYQTPAALRALVRDHFAILKVGPGATFALREALWSLSDIAEVDRARRDAAQSPRLECLLPGCRAPGARSAVQPQRPDPLLLGRAAGRGGVPGPVRAAVRRIDSAVADQSVPAAAVRCDTRGPAAQ
jgi:D-tagatose-1,6-bisphosphate aldolase subunit GatZ/KbaZ